MENISDQEYLATVREGAGYINIPCYKEEIILNNSFNHAFCNHQILYDKKIANQCKIHMYNRDIYCNGAREGREGQGNLVISRICHLISSSRSGLTNAPG